jgi:protein TonB
VSGDARIYWGALILSLGLHVALALLWPRWHADPPMPPVTMEVDLAFLEASPPPTPVPAPVPVLPEPIVQPKDSKPTPREKAVLAPERMVTPSPLLASDAGAEEAVPEASPEVAKQVSAAEPAEVPSSPIAQPASPSLPVADAAPVAPAAKATAQTDSPEEISQEDAWDGYGQLLHDFVGKHKQYPQLAVRRNWQGTVTVSARISQGKLIAIELVDSSGHKVLDEQALKMVRKAVEELPVQASLSRKSFTVLIPVDFRLAG